MFLLRPSTKIALNGSAPPNKMATRALDKKCLKNTSPEPRIQIQKSFHRNVPHNALC